jgi:hypothetical protein
MLGVMTVDHADHGVAAAGLLAPPVLLTGFG